MKLNFLKFIKEEYENFPKPIINTVAMTTGNLHQTNFTGDRQNPTQNYLSFTPIARSGVIVKIHHEGTKTTLFLNDKTKIEIGQSIFLKLKKEGLKQGKHVMIEFFGSSKDRKMILKSISIL